MLSLKYVISIHAAREGGDISLGAESRSMLISIHAAREGGDTGRMTVKFNYEISIHAAREGGDKCAHPISNYIMYFNPRRP